MFDNIKLENKRFTEDTEVHGHQEPASCLSPIMGHGFHMPGDLMDDCDCGNFSPDISIPSSSKEKGKGPKAFTFQLRQVSVSN